MSKKIAITNIVSLNPGDAAILAGMIEILQKKYGTDTEIVVSDKDAKAATALYPWARFIQAPFHRKPKLGFLTNALKKFGYGHWISRIRYWRLQLLGFILRNRPFSILKVFFSTADVNAVDEYLSSDLIVSTGGTYLIENYGLWPAIYDYRLSLSLGKPLVFFTQTLGPFTQPQYKKAFNDILTRASMIFLRDERSVEHLVEIGISKERIRLAKDAAFALRGSEKSRKDRAPGKDLKVAISVRSLRFFNDTDRDLWQAYLESVRAMVETLVGQHKAEVVFLSTCQGIPEYWTDDAATAREVASELSELALSKTRVDSLFRQPTDVIDTYAGFDLVIATRMHSAILSLVAGTPVVGIAYEFKLEELFEQLGMADLSLPTSLINPEKATATLLYAIQNLESLREQLPEVIELARSQAFSTLDGLPSLSSRNN